MTESTITEPTHGSRNAPRKPWRRTAALAALILALVCVLSGCRSRTKPPPPSPNTVVRPNEPDLLDEKVERTDKTVLEELWRLEKAVREKDRRIAVLKAELEAARRELQRLKGETGPSSPPVR